MAASFYLRALGRLEVTSDGATAALGGRRQRAVLALLALRSNSFVPVDTLCEVVWNDASLPKSPRSVLQVYVSNLRRAMEPGHQAGRSARLPGMGDGYMLVVTPDETDVGTFRQLLTTAGVSIAAGQLQDAATTLQEGVGLWRGPAFPDLEDVPDVRAELATLEEQRLTAVEDLLGLELSLGRHSHVAAEAAALVDAHPFRERLHAARITALYLDQRQGEALTACRQVRRLLAEELAAEPGPVLLELERAVLCQDVVLLRPARPQGRRRRRLSNLPVSLSSFVGREVQLDALHSLLTEDSTRLITLTGPGGTGKTRLALAAASRSDAAFLDGVCWVALDSVHDPDRVVEAVADGLGIAWTGRDAGVAVAAFLRERRMLLVLDNFEHVIDAWPTVTSMLKAGPGLTVLVTSRTPLDVTGEHRYAVPPLELPDPAASARLELAAVSESLRLFETRAAMVDPGFRLDDRNVADVARLCHGVDGLPLAIELAAARCGELTPAVLAERIVDSLGVTADGPRDAPERQRTLRDTIDWSFRMLRADQQLLFSELAVFAGSPDLAAIRAVSARPGTAAAVDELVRSSLVVADAARRIHLLQVVRAFAAEQLDARGDSDVLRRRHAEHYLATARDCSAQLEGPGQALALARLSADRAELGAAFDWATGSSADDGDTRIALGLLGSLWHFWQIEGRVTAPRHRAEELLARADSSEPALLAPALSGAGTMCFVSGDFESARAYHRRAQAQYALLGDTAGLAWSAQCLAVQDIATGDLDRAQDAARTALIMARESGHTRTLSSVLSTLAAICCYQRRFAEGEHHSREALEVARTNGDHWATGKALINLAYAVESQGEHARACTHVREALEVSRSIDDHVLATFAVETTAELCMQLGAPRRAAQLLAAAQAHRAEVAQPLPQQDAELLSGVVAATRAMVGEVAFHVAWSQGTELSLDEASRSALDWTASKVG